MWNSSGNKFTFYDKGDAFDLLPKGIYTLEYGPFNTMYLSKSKEKFEFPYKIYGHDGFPERVVKTFNEVTGNLGVMLCGLKGTGKTVQAEQIANISNLPVIVVSQQFDSGKDLIKFLSMVEQPVVVMIDEYEKIFGSSDGLLSLMDGAMSGSQRRLFVLTANDLFVADALLDRPSRIHYLKRFKNLGVDIIKEVVDDMLQFPEHRESVVEYLKNLEILTIDIVKTVLQEVNRFNESPEVFKDYLNISMRQPGRWDVKNENGSLLAEYVIASYRDPLQKKRRRRKH
jgi:SpoVK/Ycf46/Vps4 family AAA+-type ATPase